MALLSNSKSAQLDCCSASAASSCKCNGGGAGGMPGQQQQARGASKVPTAVVSLNNRQVDRLRSVLDMEVQIHGRENFPTLEIPLHRLILNMRRKLREAGLPLQHVKVNGGAASYVFANAEFPYSDVDLIFPLALENDLAFERVRNAVFDALLEMMPSSANKAAITAETLRDVYIRKMVKVTDGDRWSLFSLHNDFGRCIELKFVDRMRRQFEFSVDSFQITLDPLIECPAEQRPVVRAESMYGDFMQALYHLNKRLIDTRNPEEIRGGGLLKYCHLLTRGYSATANCRDMEKYMCSRFFIDFSDINVQEIKLLNYLQNHFGAEDEMKLDYLHKLYYVIRDSTVCLMWHERKQTLNMVDRLRQQLSFSMMLFYPQHYENGGGSVSGQMNGGNGYSGGHGNGNRWRRHNNRHWHGRNGHSSRHHGQQQFLCPSPVSTIASSSIEEESARAGDELAAPLEALAVGGPAPKAANQQQSAAQHKPQQHVPRQTLLYLPPNASHWIPVV